MQIITSLAISVAALIHLLPLIGVLGADKLKSLYGTQFTDPNILIMMQHRAVLFGLIGGLLVFAIFKQEYRGLAIIIALVSATSFLLIAMINGGYNEQLRSVVIADVIAIVALLIAAGALKYSSQ